MNKQKFSIGEVYKLKYSRVINSILVETTGDFEFIRRQGSSYYLFENDKGIDLVINKKELLKAIENGKS